MKKSKLFLLSGLAMLTMAFAMSCSNPAGGDTTPAPTPKPTIEGATLVSSEAELAKVVKAGAQIIELSNDMTITNKDIGLKNLTFYTGSHRLTLADGLGEGNIKLSGEVYVSKDYGKVLNVSAADATKYKTKVYTDPDYTGDIWGQTTLAEVKTLEELKAALSTANHIDAVELVADIDLGGETISTEKSVTSSKKGDFKVTNGKIVKPEELS